MELIITVFTALINILLGLFAFLKNPRSDTHRLLALLAFIFSFFAIVNYLSVNSSNAADTLFWIRVVMFSGSLMGPTLFLLVRAFPKHKISVSPLHFWLIWIFTGTVAILTLTPLVFSSVTYEPPNIQPNPGPAIILFGIDFLGFSIAAFITLIKKYTKSSGVEKLQIRYLLLGIITTFSFTATTSFILVNVFNNSNYVFLGPFYTLLLVGSITYAVVKHRLLDIKLVVARSVALILLVFFIGGIYSLSLFLIGTFLLSVPFSTSSIIFYGLIALVVAFTFQPLKRTIENKTDKFFYRGGYESNVLLAKLSLIMSTYIDLHELTEQILKILVEEVKVSKGAFVLLEENTIYEIVELGYGGNFKHTYNQLRPLLAYSNLLIVEEIEDQELKQTMTQLDISVSQLLVVKDQVIGLLVLGDKSSGEIYLEQDLRVLEILAPEAAVAIQNSQSVDKIKRFNITLSEEIDRATRQLRVANAKLQELDQLKDDFVSVASHELRTPMTAIRSYSWMALNKADIPLSEKMKKYLSRTLISTERLINLVNEMLNISRIESGRIEIRPEIFNVTILVKDVFEEVSVKAAEKHLNLKIGEIKNIPNVFADQGKIHQILLNLIGNALKFTPENGNIEVNFAANQSVVGVAIKDSGVGISKQDRAKLFKKFGRLNNSYVTAGASGGTGLGLYVCKSLIQLMGGEIWVVSEGVGKGSTFYFTIPIASKEVLAHVEKYQLKPDGEAKILEPVTI